MKQKKNLIIITFLIIIIVSSAFYLPFRRHGVVQPPYVLDEKYISEYSTKEYHHIYNIPSSKFISVKPKGQLNFVNVELKYSVIYEELLVRYIIIIISTIIIYNSHKLFRKKQVTDRVIDYCEKCGEQIDEDSLFCKYCGADNIIEKPESLNEISKGMGIDNPIHVSWKKEFLEEHRRQWQKYERQQDRLLKEKVEMFKLKSVSEFERDVIQLLAIDAYSREIVNQPMLQFLLNIKVIKDIYLNELLRSMDEQGATSNDKIQYLLILAYHAFGAGSYLTMKSAEVEIVDNPLNNDTAIILKDLFQKGSLELGLQSMQIHPESKNKKVIDHMIISTLEKIYNTYEKELNSKDRKEYLIAFMNCYFNLGVTLAKRIIN